MMLQTDPPAPEPEAAEESDSPVEYMEVAIDRIETGAQVRTGIDPAGESILALAESIRERGVIQPLTVCRSGDGYFLTVGERRLLAAKAAGLATVPVRIIPTIQRQEDALSLQLAENLQREDLNPMDMAEGIYALVRSRHGDVSVDAIINLFILAERSPERVPSEFVGTLPTIVKLSGKSLTSLKRLLTFKKLPDALQEALRSGLISLTQGYLFSDYLDNPELLSIFQTLLTHPVTNEKLKEQLEAYAKKPVRGRPREYRPFAGIHTSIKNAGMTIGDMAAPVTRDDLAKLLDALHALAAQIESRIGSLPPEEGA
jgi:hypothetical protein